MTIKEMEERTGLSRSNIRFYEKEKLLEPVKNESNGYKEYSEKDVEDVKKIAYLRTLGISIEDIRKVMTKKAVLRQVLEKQNRLLQEQMIELSQAKAMCEKMLEAEPVSYEELEIEQYVEGVQDYWKENQSVFRVDSVSFLYLWGSTITWGVITCLCLVLGLLTYDKLPAEIPIQWSEGVVTSSVGKIFIFAYPILCILCRFVVRPYIYVKWNTNNQYTEIIAEYLTNYICFVIFSVEVFSVLFIWGIVKNVVTVLVIDTIIFIGLLIIGIIKMDLTKKV